MSTAITPGHSAPLTAARDAFLAAVQAAFAAMLGKLDDALFGLAESTDSDLERGSYFDAVRELRLARETVESRFMDNLRAAWQGLERGDGAAQRPLGAGDHSELLALAAAVRRVEGECADALREVRDGLALAVGVPDGEQLIGPRQVFAAFEAASRDTPADPAVRLVVLKFFERHMGAALPGIYRNLAGALQAAGRAAPAGPGELPVLQAQPLEGEPGASEPDLHQLIQRALAGESAPGGEALQLLATLQQHEEPGGRTRTASIDLARIATRPAPGEDPSQQMAFDMVTLLFEGLFSDATVPVSARLQIARLQIPFLRLALRDRAMLARRSHLGRRFFDQLIAVTRAWPEPPTPPQQELLCALIDRVGEACMDDHRAFAAAAEAGLADLRAVSLPPAQAAQAAQAARKALAARVDKELAERRQRAGRLPHPVDTFLSTHWKQYLVDCLQRHGADASPWQQALATLDALLWSLSPKSGSARQRLAELRPRLLRRLRQGMDQVGVSMFEQEAFLDRLDEMLDRAQAGQPVWDWQEESAIDALLGAPPAADGLATPPPAPAPSASPAAEPAAEAAPAPSQPAAPAGEEVVSLEALELDEVAPLPLPGQGAGAPPAGDAPAEAPAAGDAPTSEVGTLEALLRRRGITGAVQVEEVEITERGPRS